MKTNFFTIKNILLQSGLLFAVLFLFVSQVEAKTVVRSGDAVSIAEDQTIEGDFYSAAGKVNVSGSVEEDMIAAAGQISVNGTIGANAFLIGGQTDIHGVVKDDLRIIAGETTIAEPVEGDVLVVGGSVNILSTASIAGDVILFVGEAIIEGPVGGDVIGTVGILRVDSPVSGKIDVAVDQFTLGDRANIEGSVRYVSDQTVVKALNASVSGDMVRSDPVLPGSKPTVYSTSVPILILLFSVLVWHLLSRKSLSIVTRRAVTKSPRPILLGIAVLFLAPVAGALLLVSVIGTVVGVIVLLGYALLIILSFTAVPAVLGKLLTLAFNQPIKKTTVLSLFVGGVGIAFLMLLPVIGQVVFMVLVILTLGAMVDALLKPEKELD